MQAGARGFANSIKPGNVGLAVHVGNDAATLIMCGGDHRQRVLGHIDTVTQAGLVDIGKAVDEEPGRFVSDVQPDMVRARFLHLGIDCAGHDIARGEGFQRMISIHEIITLDRL